MTSLLDTDVIVDVLRQRPAVVRRLETASPDDFAITCVTVAELAHGAERSADPARAHALWRGCIGSYQVLPFDRDAAEHHGRLRHALRHGPIGERDLLIAAIAVANHLTVVTRTAREFGRVPGLRVEAWAT